MAAMSSFLQVFIVLGMYNFVFLLTYWKWHWQSEENPIFGLYSRVLIKGDSLAEAKEEKPLKAPTFFETQDTGTKVSRFCKMEQKVFTTMHSGTPLSNCSRQVQGIFYCCWLFLILFFDVIFDVVFFRYFLHYFFTLFFDVIFWRNFLTVLWHYILMLFFDVTFIHYFLMLLLNIVFWLYFMTLSFDVIFWCGKLCKDLCLALKLE